MRAATREEYEKAKAAAIDQKIMEASRCQDIVWSRCGVEIAHCTKIFTRGKVSQEYFMVNDEVFPLDPPAVTKHSPGCRMAYGRKDPDCFRCKELLNGAQARDGWQKAYFGNKRGQ